MKGFFIAYLIFSKNFDIIIIEDKNRVIYRKGELYDRNDEAGGIAGKQCGAA